MAEHRKIGTGAHYRIRCKRVDNATGFRGASRAFCASTRRSVSIYCRRRALQRSRARLGRGIRTATARAFDWGRGRHLRAIAPYRAGSRGPRSALCRGSGLAAQPVRFTRRGCFLLLVLSGGSREPLPREPSTFRQLFHRGRSDLPSAALRCLDEPRRAGDREGARGEVGHGVR
jgi:hypothetical protein